MSSFSGDDAVMQDFDQFVTIDPGRCVGEKPEVELTAGCWVGGGAVRSWVTGEASADIDVYGETSEALQAFKRANGLSDPVRKSPVAETYRNEGMNNGMNDGMNNGMNGIPRRIQVCLEPRFIRQVENFDFTICLFAWDGKEIKASMDALLDCAAKRLTLNTLTPNYEYDSLRRSFKYVARGYRIHWKTIATLVEAVRSVSEKNWSNQMSLGSDSEEKTEEIQY